MTRPAIRPLAPAAALALIALLLAGCVSNAPAGGGSGTISVESNATTCILSTNEAPAGTITFSVKNTGDEATEFYLLGEDGVRVIGEVENIGPGLTRDLVVQPGPGSYVAACKPGMTGDGIRFPFSVTGTAASGSPAAGGASEQLAAAEAAYLTYVRDHAAALIAGTQAFAEAYTAGDDDTAREMYAPTRVHWESIEPVAESFGDLDPLLDAREADLAEGEAWSGWHLIEKDLWPPAADANGGTTYTPLTTAERQAAARDLVAYTQQVVDKVDAGDFTFAAFQISNGAKELLDEVATGKVTGEEEAWSHTDLWDFQANVDGAEQAFEVLEAAASARDPELVETLETRFDALNALLARHGSIDAGFKPYDQLTSDEVQELAAGVDALGEPLSKLTAAITGS